MRVFYEMQYNSSCRVISFTMSLYNIRALGISSKPEEMLKIDVDDVVPLNEASP